MIGRNTLLVAPIVAKTNGMGGGLGVSRIELYEVDLVLRARVLEPQFWLNFPELIHTNPIHSTHIVEEFLDFN